MKELLLNDEQKHDLNQDYCDVKMLRQALDMLEYWYNRSLERECYDTETCTKIREYLGVVLSHATALNGNNEQLSLELEGEK